MANSISTVFIVSILSILLASFLLHKETQFTSSLQKINSILKSIKSIYEKPGPLNDEDIAEIEKINLEMEEFIASRQNNQEWIPYLKTEFLTYYVSNVKPHLDFLTSIISEVSLVFIKTLEEWLQALNFTSNLKPHLDFLTSKISEVYLVSINTLVTIIEKFQKSATTFIKELHKSAIPYIMKMSMWLLSELVKGLNAFFQFCLEAAR